MILPAMLGETGLVYKGHFERGLREGDGMLEKDISPRSPGANPEVAAAEKEPAMLYNGMWKNDCIFATKEYPAWSQVGNHIYYGEFTKSGVREGEGILYSAEALKDLAFKEAMRATNAQARKYEPPDNKYKLYKGLWSNNQPNGVGRQYFSTGEYLGQFMNGERHGRGTWDAHGKGSGAQAWTYRPVAPAEGEVGPPNWEHDKMHGVAIIEDAKHVHENVLYTRGKSQMPWTETGPPATALGNVGLASLLGGGSNRAEPETIEVDQRDNVVTRGTANTNPDALEAVEPEALAVLIRQPTDLDIPEEDIWITGGTRENAVMNGIYFKMYGSYGQPIYKLAKRMPGMRNTFLARLTPRSFKNWNFGGMQNTARYLYRHSSQEYWVVADQPDRVGTEKMTNWAYVKSTASRPSEIPHDADWFVWHDQTQMMRQTTEILTQAAVSSVGCMKTEIQPVDQLRIGIVVGYEVTGLESHVASFLLRHPSQFFGRPVFEAESIAQCLFWIEENGQVSDGYLDDELELGVTAASKDRPFLNRGYWVLASEPPLEGITLKWDDDASKTAGLPYRSLHAIAWVKDNAVTPDSIADISVWQVLDTATGKHSENTAMRIRPEEWKSKARVNRAKAPTNAQSQDSKALALVSNNGNLSTDCRIVGLDD
jgi:hypothetical protein